MCSTAAPRATLRTPVAQRGGVGPRLVFHGYMQPARAKCTMTDHLLAIYGEPPPPKTRPRKATETVVSLDDDGNNVGPSTPAAKTKATSNAAHRLNKLRAVAACAAVIDVRADSAVLAASFGVKKKKDEDADSMLHALFFRIGGVPTKAAAAKVVKTEKAAAARAAKAVSKAAAKILAKPAAPAPRKRKRSVDGNDGLSLAATVAAVLGGEDLESDAA